MHTPRLRASQAWCSRAQSSRPLGPLVLACSFRPVRDGSTRRELIVLPRTREIHMEVLGQFASRVQVEPYMLDTTGSLGDAETFR
jgi:hypothetical protein